ncbi:hypothetical protein SAMN02910447_00618 [Ruminococcus sp. YE71]|uniref:fibronectin type III domain-containing protein n=1 Tax=unclassified Ruminococcus TaxID=2608920 RepID=UPI000881E54F|nr:MULTISPECIES: fibronectin type III domain-containing protein [unclassified Ruminococcus]SDA12608.1 hypothetical protein SAMN02910446_00617 [Ruminococcus sp. YE78]SFW17187.1 hypothetical protein SAMN02910447_00618 [Ruminococcus sp. YE71]
MINSKRSAAGIAAAALTAISMAVPTAGSFFPFAQNTIVAAASTSGAKVYDTEEKTYELLHQYITEVAAGTRDSTEFSVSMKDLGLEGRYFSAKDLGVDSIVVNGQFSSDAVNVANEIINCNIGRILSRLTSECPYELYWFDKTTGVGMASGVSISAKYDRTAGEYLLGFTGDMTYSFYVSDDYAAGKLQVDHKQILRANAVLANAEKIIKKYENASDREKLDGYRKEICQLVSYNDDAVGGNVSYGDPWQMIYVFDGDQSTNVVCEGYSKAFKYLCDHTKFSSERVSCILVSGMMSSSTSSGNHMWNIVTLEDGNNYLADLTNCDEGSIGADDLLFLMPYTSGDYEEGYIFDVRSQSIMYTYDSDTREYYGNDRLDLEYHDHSYDDTGIAVDYTPGDGAVRLNWTELPNADKYAVVAYLNGEWTKLAEGKTNTYTIKGLTAGTKYKVAVIAMINGKWNYDVSNAIIVTPNAPAYPKTSAEVQGNAFRLNWTSVPNAQKYVIAYTTNGKNWKVAKTVDSKTTSFTYKNTPKGTYYIVVGAVVNGKLDTSDLTNRAVKVVIK